MLLTLLGGTIAVKTIYFNYLNVKKDKLLETRSNFTKLFDKLHPNNYLYVGFLKSVGENTTFVKNIKKTNAIFK